MLIGFEKPWFPALSAAQMNADRNLWFRGSPRLESVLTRFERLARPRYWLLPQIIVERVVSIVALSVNVPDGRFADSALLSQIPALSMILLAIGLGEQDGVWLGTGFLSRPWAELELLSGSAPSVRFGRAAYFWLRMTEQKNISIYVECRCLPGKSRNIWRSRAIWRQGFRRVGSRSTAMPPRSDDRAGQLAGDGFDAADDWIAERVSRGDVVVTADIPLAEPLC